MTDVFQAARDGLTSTLKRLKADGRSLDEQDELGNTALHYALLNGHDITAEYLAQNMATPNATNKAGLTATLAAVLENDDQSTAVYARKADAIESLLSDGHVDLQALDPEGRTVLHRAIDFGSAGIVQAVLRCGRSVANMTNARGETALMVAVSRGDEATVTRLLQHGADVDVRSMSGDTALTFAVRAKLSSVVKVFLQQNANADTVTTDGSTALMIAVRVDALDIFNLLSGKKVATDVRDSNGHTALRVAIDLNQDKYVRQLAAALSRDIADNDGVTPLMVAAGKDYQGFVRVLVDNKAQVNLQDKNGDSALHYAARAASVAIVEMLMRAGANDRLLNNAGRTPYQETTDRKTREKFKEFNIDVWAAAFKGELGMVQKLLDNGQNPDAFDDDHQAPLHIACRKGHPKIVEALLKAKATVDILNDEKASPLHLVLIGEASNDVRAQLLKLLINAGADATRVCGDGRAPIHIATGLKSAAIVKALLEKVGRGAVDLPDANGETPLQVAANAGDVPTIDALLECGANVEITNKDGCTPLQVACRANNTAVAAKLLERGARPDVADRNGMTPLLEAVQHASGDLVDALLKAKVNVHQVAGDSGNCVMHLAAQKDQADLVTKFLNAGFSADVQNARGQTPLMLAAAASAYHAFNVLVNDGKANLNMQDKDGNTALHYCAMHGEIESMRRLLRADARGDVLNNDGKSARDVNDHPQVMYLFEEFETWNKVQAPSDDVDGLVPCEFCNKLFTLQAIMAHQFNCTSRS